MGGSVSITPPESSSNRRLTVTLFDCPITYSTTESATPHTTAYWSGIVMVRTNVITKTIRWAVPVFQTETRSCGRIVR